MLAFLNCKESIHGNFLEARQREAEQERIAIKKHLDDSFLIAKVEMASTALRYQRPPGFSTANFPLNVLEIDDITINIRGKNSSEKAIQEKREASLLMAVYLKDELIPSSPGEPDQSVFRDFSDVIVKVIPTEELSQVF